MSPKYANFVIAFYCKHLHTNRLIHHYVRDANFTRPLNSRQLFK